MKRNIYSGHMRNAGKKKTRYTDAEISRIKEDAYNRGRSDSGQPSAGGSHEAFSRGHHKGRIAQLDELEYWLENAIGRPGKRQVLDKIAETKSDLEGGID